MFRTASLISSIECRHYLQSQVHVTEALPLRSIDCCVLAYTALSIDRISRNTRQVTYSESKDMWVTLFVCSRWTSERVCYFAPVCMRSIAISFCLSVCLSAVCLSARISQKSQVEISPNCLYMLPLAVARFSSDDNAGLIR